MPTLASILAGIQRIISQLASLLAPIAYIQVQTTFATKEHSPYQVYNLVNGTHTLVSDPTDGLVAIHSELVALQASVTALGAPQQTGVAVTLPALTPAGGTWIDSGNIGGAVWGYQTPTSHTAIIELMDKLDYYWLGFDNTFTRPTAGSPYFDVTGGPIPAFGTLNGTQIPQPDVGAILSTDTLQTWLTRELTGWTISPGFWGGTQISVWNYGLSNFIFNCLLDDRTFAILQQTLFPAVLNVPPVWPGLAGVTLGSAVALSDGLVVTGPLQGVLVAITSVPSPISYYPFGTIRSYVRAGAVVFTDDNGQSEFPEPFGPDSQLIVPRHMMVAAAATIRLPSGIVGTVQPFTIP